MTTDHECLRNSIVNLAAMIPLDEVDSVSLDLFLVRAIEKSEEGDV